MDLTNLSNLFQSLQKRRGLGVGELSPDELANPQKPVLQIPPQQNQGIAASIISGITRGATAGATTLENAPEPQRLPIGARGEDPSANLLTQEDRGRLSGIAQSFAPRDLAQPVPLGGAALNESKPTGTASNATPITDGRLYSSSLPAPNTGANPTLGGAPPNLNVPELATPPDPSKADVAEHHGFGNRLKHGLKGLAIGALQGAASSTGNPLGGLLGGAVTGLSLGIARPQLADNLEEEVIKAPAREMEAAKQYGTARRQLELQKEQAEIENKRADTTHKGRISVPRGGTVIDPQFGRIDALQPKTTHPSVAPGHFIYNEQTGQYEQIGQPASKAPAWRQEADGTYTDLNTGQRATRDGQPIKGPLPPSAANSQNRDEELQATAEAGGPQEIPNPLYQRALDQHKKIVRKEMTDQFNRNKTYTADLEPQFQPQPPSDEAIEAEAQKRVHALGIKPTRTETPADVRARQAKIRIEKRRGAQTPANQKVDPSEYANWLRSKGASEDEIKRRVGALGGVK